MQSNKWAAWFGLALVLFITGLACQTTDRILTVAQAQTATPTRTRTVRPTFTPLPPPADTAAPTSTTVPPTATRRPPTPRPPTPKPLPTQPPAPPQPTKPQYAYTMNGYRCEHSGGSWLKGHVYENSDPNSAVPGVGVVFGGGGGDIYDGPNLSDGNGDFAFVLTPDGAGARIGTYFIWLVDGSKNRISPMAGPITINGRPDTDPATCWAGWAFFTKN